MGSLLITLKPATHKDQLLWSSGPYLLAQLVHLPAAVHSGAGPSPHGSGTLSYGCIPGGKAGPQGQVSHSAAEQVAAHIGFSSIHPHMSILGLKGVSLVTTLSTVHKFSGGHLSYLSLREDLLMPPLEGYRLV